MIDPCEASIMGSFSIANMQRVVFEAGMSQKLLDSKDTVSATYGNKDGLTYCGPRLIELTTSPIVFQNFLSFDQAS